MRKKHKKLGYSHREHRSKKNKKEIDLVSKDYKRRKEELKIKSYDHY